MYKDEYNEYEVISQSGAKAFSKKQCLLPFTFGDVLHPSQEYYYIFFL